MKKILLLISLTLSIMVASFSQDIDNDNFTITHGPYLQNLTSSGITFVWTTNKPAVPGVSLTSPDGTVRFVRNSHDGIVDGGGILHKVRVEGLEPGRTYKYSISSVQILKYQAYRIYYGDTLVRRAESFDTPPTASGLVRFTVINDVHENAGKMGSYLRHETASFPDFYVFNGDMVDYLQSVDQLFSGFIGQ